MDTNENLEELSGIFKADGFEFKSRGRNAVKVVALGLCLATITLIVLASLAVIWVV